MTVVHATYVDTLDECTVDVTARADAPLGAVLANLASAYAYPRYVRMSIREQAADTAEGSTT